MTSFYHSIETSRLSEKPVLSEMGKNTLVNLDSPAIDLMEAFTSVKPINLQDHMPYEKIREILFETHANYGFVTNSQKKVIGFIPIEHLVGLRAMTRANELNIKLKELTARDLMEPIGDMPTIRLSQVNRSKLGDVLHTFKHQVDEYLVVTEDDSPSIRGLFSARAINHALGLSNQTRFQARTVSDMAQIINGHYPKI
jgi:hypothetical protein